MNDVEARLRRTLRKGLDGVAADPGRAAATVRRARRGRALRGVAAGLAGVLLAGAAAIAWEGSAEDPPPPAGEPEQVTTFALDFANGRGTLTVDVAKAQACFDFSRATSSLGAQLMYDPPGPDDAIAATLGLPARRPSPPQCRPVDPSDAARVVAEPGRHYVSLAIGYVPETSSLEPLDTAPENAPKVVKIVCSQDGAVVLTPHAQPRRDGVHLEIHNQAGAWREFNLTSPEGGGSSGDGLPRRRVYTDAGNIAPGPHSIGCFRDDDSIQYDPSHPDYATFTIVDPNDLWIDPELDCDAPRQRAEIVTEEHRDLEELPDYEALIRDHVPGLRDDDVIVRATYPESAAKLEHRTIVRDGAKIATLYLGIDEDPAAPGKFLWSILPSVCPGSGIAPE